jgi:multiple sugar transport system permease protein
MSRPAPIPQRALVMLVLTLVCVTTVVPFIWTLSMSLRTEENVLRKGIVPTSSEQRATIGDREVRVRVLRELDDGRQRVKVVEPGWEGQAVHDIEGRARTVEWVDPQWKNYPEAWNAYPFLSFGRAYLNSLVVALLVTLGQVVTCTLAAYAFARLQFPGRDLLFFAYLATMMVPGAVTIIPTFVLLKNLPDACNWLFGTNWFSQEFVFGGTLVGINSYFALIMPRCFSAYGTFMLRQYFLSIPRELEEAAYLDGCTTFGVLRHVVMPLSKPALATLGIFTFMWAWGDFFWPLIVTTTDDIKTLPLLLQSFQGQYGAKWHLLMAASIMGLIPMLIVFLIGQRQFIEGIKLGAVKG